MKGGGKGGALLSGWRWVEEEAGGGIEEGACGVIVDVGEEGVEGYNEDCVDGG